MGFFNDFICPNTFGLGTFGPAVAEELLPPEGGAGKELALGAGKAVALGAGKELAFELAAGPVSAVGLAGLPLPVVLPELEKSLSTGGLSGSDQSSKSDLTGKPVGMGLGGGAGPVRFGSMGGIGSVFVLRKSRGGGLI